MSDLASILLLRALLDEANNVKEHYTRQGQGFFEEFL
eukprot:CAMPEP_0194671176 /NCGR_PEP_ID=MMETSP0295-20121207/5663_1 /TAXON_ID=39354 /ORGANISM="Heterosigma akashiwo, Strain CCMP2393" /LENGTH=36 /DNA_ID= /DNA_START= /DNA_END= /DNA_ORIENTATION=